MTLCKNQIYVKGITIGWSLFYILWNQMQNVHEIFFEWQNFIDLEVFVICVPLSHTLIRISKIVAKDTFNCLKQVLKWDFFTSDQFCSWWNTNRTRLKIFIFDHSKKNKIPRATIFEECVCSHNKHHDVHHHLLHTLVVVQNLAYDNKLGNSFWVKKERCWSCSWWKVFTTMTHISWTINIVF